MEDLSIYEKFVIFVTTDEKDTNYKNFLKLTQEHKKKLNDIDILINKVDNSKFTLTLIYMNYPLLMQTQFEQQQLDEILDTIKNNKNKPKSKSQTGGATSYKQKYYKYKNKYHELKKVIISYH